MPLFLEQAAALRRPAKKRVGALQQIPQVPPPREQLASALKRAARVAPPAAVKNEAERERSRAARQLDALMKELSVPLTKALAGFPKVGALHPFEAALLDLTVGAAAYSAITSRVAELRKAVQEVGKAYASRASRAATKKEAAAVAEEGAATLEKVFSRGAKDVDDLRRVSRQLRALPFVEPGLPTLALVGAPNVGKSSLVQILSSGAPEICDYPFTTRSIKLGHFWVDARQHQVTDTPGLLARSDDRRNAMERLTLAALEHLPSAAVFVADLTGLCGTRVADQWAVREELRGRFPEKLWVDVLSKSDLLGGLWAQADEEGGGGDDDEAAAAARGGGGGQTGGAVAIHTDASAAAAEEDAAAALAFARLPGAVRVSSLTGDGVGALKLRVLEELRRAGPGAAGGLDGDGGGGDSGGGLGGAAASAAQQE